MGQGREGHRKGEEGAYRERGGERERGTACPVFVIVVIRIFVVGTGITRIVVVRNFFWFSCPTAFKIILYYLFPSR